MVSLPAEIRPAIEAFKEKMEQTTGFELTMTAVLKHLLERALKDAEK
jgi:hypothetical protein